MANVANPPVLRLDTTDAGTVYSHGLKVLSVRVTNNAGTPANPTLRDTAGIIVFAPTVQGNSVVDFNFPDGAMWQGLANIAIPASMLVEIQTK